MSPKGLLFEPSREAAASYSRAPSVLATAEMSANPSPATPAPPGTTDAALSAVELGRRLQVITRAAGIGWWSLEGRAERAQWSDELRELHGLAADEPVPRWGDWIRRWAHPDERAELARRWSAWMDSPSDEPLDHSFRIARRGGGWRDILLHALVERAGPEALRFGVLIDISEQRSAERALRQANERAALAARGAGFGTWELDLLSGEVHWDERMWLLRGRAPRTQAPDYDERYGMVHPQDRESVRQTLHRGESANLPLDLEFRVVWPDGQVRWLASRSTVVFDEAGRATRRIGANWDVTANRDAEAARQEKAIALRESEAKSRFLSRMSHELRTPLNAVIGFAQLMLADEPGHPDGAATRVQRLQHVLAAGQHLLSLVDDVLDLTALEGGELAIVPEPLLLSGVLAEAAPLVEALRQRCQVRLAFGPLGEAVLADRTRLRQVVLNLLTNAVKFNRPGGWVDVSSEPDGEQVVLRVADGGRGMTAEQLAHLFEPFNRLGIDGEAIEGTGIGLTIVKSLVERMDGRIEARSTAGQGSVFEVRLPAARRVPIHAPATPSPAWPPVAAPGPVPQAPSILYIEDNSVNALIVTQLVQRRPDLRFEVANTGLLGLERALSMRPSLVLLDMQLPDIDGYEVFRRLRADPRTAATPCIALSANALPQDIEHALRSGLADYWTKPLDFGQFMAALERWFGPPPAT